MKQAIITDIPVVRAGDAATAAVTLRAGLPGVSVLSGTERAMLAEWLDRIADPTITRK